MKSFYKKIAIGSLLLGCVSSSAFAQPQQVRGTLTACASNVYIVDVEMGVPANGYDHFLVGYNTKPYRDSNTSYLPAYSEVDDYAGRAMYEQAINAMDMGLKVDLLDDHWTSNCSSFDAFKAYIPPVSA